MSVSLQDIVKGLDPTGFNSISGAELAQMVDNVSPSGDRSINIWTEDTADVPDVPNPETSDAYNKFKRYLWIRQTATTTKVYAWNDTAASDATYLKWLDLTNLSIATGSVTNAMLAGGITNDKLVSIEYAKVSGAPTSLAPTGAAGGSLAGTYPNPSLAAQAVTAAAVSDLVGAKVVQRVFTTETAATAITTELPQDDTIPTNIEGDQVMTCVITPKALTDYLIVEFTTFAGNTDDGEGVSATLFHNGSVTPTIPIQGTSLDGSGTNGCGRLSMRWEGLVSDINATLAALTFSVRVGPSTGGGTARINGAGNTRLFGGIAKSVLSVTEYRP